ncbi:MAG: hypothetical protein ACRD3I_04050, partial [Terriglobales bacterium]
MRRPCSERRRDVGEDVGFEYPALIAASPDETLELLQPGQLRIRIHEPLDLAAQRFGRGQCRGARTELRVEGGTRIACDLLPCRRDRRF